MVKMSIVLLLFIFGTQVLVYWKSCEMHTTATTEATNRHTTNQYNPKIAHHTTNLVVNLSRYHGWKHNQKLQKLIFKPQEQSYKHMYQSSMA